MSTGPAAERRPLWRRVAAHPFSHFLAALIIVALVQSLLVKVYHVPSGSMEPTLQSGDRILVNRLAYLGADPAAGDLVVFNRPDDWAPTGPQPSLLRSIAGWFGDRIGFGPSNEHALAKRIVAGPSQTVECCDADGRLLIDGAGVDEPHVVNDVPFTPGELDCESVPRSQRCFAPITPNSDRYVVLGDNRASSSDSISLCRGLEIESSSGCARLVTRDQLVGTAFFVLLPPDRWGEPLAAPHRP